MADEVDKTVIELKGGAYDGMRFEPEQIKELESLQSLLAHYVHLNRVMDARNEELISELREIAKRDDGWSSIHAAGVIAAHKAMQ